MARSGARPTSRSVGGTAVDALEEAGRTVAKAAARAREEADDIWAEARQAADKNAGRDAAVGLGLATTVAVGALELPIAAALGVGYALFRRR